MRDLKDEDNDSDNNEVGVEKGGTTMTPSTTKNATRKGKKNLATTTAAKKNKKKNNPRKESCGVVELVQAMMVMTRMSKLILCVLRDVRTITTCMQAKQHKFGDV